MYKSKYVTSFDIVATIDGVDIYNSYALLNLDRQSYSTMELFPISSERLDLVTNSIYNSTNNANYSGVIGILNRVTDEKLLTNIKYVPDSVITSLGS